MEFNSAQSAGSPRSPVKPALNRGEIMFKGINWLAVVLAAFANVAIGFVWFNVLFTQQWHALDPSAPAMTGFDPKRLGGVVCALLIFTGQAWIFARTGVSSLRSALLTALFVCITFDSTVYAGFVFFSGGSAKAMAFYGAFDVVGYLVGGAILGLMRPKTAS